MKRYIKLTSLLLAFTCIFGTLLCSCGSSADANGIKYDETILSVGGHEVSYGLYRYFFLNYKAGYTEAQLSENPDKVYGEIKEACYESLCGLYSIIAMCADHGIGVSDEDIKQKVATTKDSIKEQYKATGDKSGEKGFREEMEANFMTEEVFNFVFAVDFCEEKLFTKMTSADGALYTDDATFRRILDEEFVRVLQIYISTDNKDKTYEECKALAEKVAKKAKEGADFNELVAENSNDYSMTRDGYYMPRGWMDEKFETVAFALEEGEVSDVLELGDGFHIIKRFEKEDTYIEKNYDTLKERYLTCRFYEKVDVRQAALHVTEHELFAKVKPEKIG